MSVRVVSVFFFFNDTATTEIYTLSLHDALPISPPPPKPRCTSNTACFASAWASGKKRARTWNVRRSEEHTSELQSQSNLVCRLLLEKKNKLGAPEQCPHSGDEFHRRELLH